MEKSTDIYPSDIESDGQTDLCITIENKDGDYIVKFFIAGVPKLCKSFYIFHSFEETNTFLNLAADYLARSVFGNKNHSVSDLLLGSLNTDDQLGLAARGYSERNRLFPSGLITEARRYLNAVENQPSRISVRSDEFAIPWDWLYDSTPNKHTYSLSRENLLKGFWGINSIVARQPIEKAYNFKATSYSSTTHTNYRKRPKVAFFYDESLSHAVQEKKMLKKLQDDGLIELHDFESHFSEEAWNDFFAPNNHNHFDLIEEFHRYILEPNDYDILHFACHAEEADIKSGVEEHFRLFRSIRYQKSMLNWTPEIVQLNNPIIILNACTTKSRKPYSTFNFINEFWSRGASNIICIESHISSRIALELISQFYAEFLEGNSLGLSLHNAKKVILNQNKSPREIMALFYALYGNHNIRLDGE